MGLQLSGIISDDPEEVLFRKIRDEMTSLADAEFAVYAAEDIFTPDWQRDENGNRIVIHAKDALVATVKTD